MMNDIIEEPEKDTLLETQPERQVLSVMSAKANPANASLLIESGRLAAYLSFSVLTVV